MSDAEEFEAVRRDPDPLRRGQRATELITLYQQRGAELSRLRKLAIEEARNQLGLTYGEIASRFGISPGRITQIRSSAPAVERAFFGVGPVAVGIPRRFGVEDGRERPYFDADDMATRGDVESTLGRLALVSTRFDIGPDQVELPTGDVVLICGPKSAPVAQTFLETDPVMSFVNEEGGWWITDAKAGKRFDSPFRRDRPVREDVGYFARHTVDGRVVVHIAGITSVGSRGVAAWLDANLSELFRASPDEAVSGAVLCKFDSNHNISATELVAGPHRW
ncbi:helix-turn-helix domain-containing protein [Nocardia goodfellowii]